MTTMDPPFGQRVFGRGGRLGRRQNSPGRNLEPGTQAAAPGKPQSYLRPVGLRRAGHPVAVFLRPDRTKRENRRKFFARRRCHGGLPADREEGAQVRVGAAVPRRGQAGHAGVRFRPGRCPAAGKGGQRRAKRPRPEAAEAQPRFAVGQVARATPEERRRRFPRR